ncbi:MAG: hypothetical protein IT438_04705 [Phycisphaerales bacterium]|nr:hypothetical protein [Phycisphaerales bacterium]
MLLPCLAIGTIASQVRADRPAIEQTLRAIEKTVLAGDIEGYLKHVATDDPIFLKEQQNWAADFKHHIPTAFKLSIVDPPPPPPPTPPKTAEAPSSTSTDERKPGEKQPDADADADDDDHDGVQPFTCDDAEGVAIFELRMDWTMTGVGRRSRDLDRTISYPVKFVRAKSVAADGAPRWLYCGEVWAAINDTPKPAAETPEADDDEPSLPRSTSPNRCLFFPGFEDVAKRIIEVLPEVRAHVDEGFENPIKHVQEIKIYPTMQHLQASIYLSYADGLGGWNEPGESIKLLASNKSGKQQLRSLLAHEYGHVATFEYGPHASDMPWWILEGVAELSAEHFNAARREAGAKNPDAAPPRGRGGRGRDADAVVKGWARAGELAAWDDLTDFRTVKSSLGGHVYKQGQHMLGYISERFGRAKRNAWLKSMAQGAKLNDATQTVLGISFADLDAAWRATLPKKEDAVEDAPASDSRATDPLP